MAQKPRGMSRPLEVAEVACRIVMNGKLRAVGKG